MNKTQDAVFSKIPRAIGMLEGTIGVMQCVKDIDTARVSKNIEEAINLLLDAKKGICEDVADALFKNA